MLPTTSSSETAERQIRRASVGRALDDPLDAHVGDAALVGDVSEREAGPMGFTDGGICRSARPATGACCGIMGHTCSDESATGSASVDDHPNAPDGFWVGGWALFALGAVLALASLLRRKRSPRPVLPLGRRAAGASGRAQAGLKSARREHTWTVASVLTIRGASLALGIGVLLACSGEDTSRQQAASTTVAVATTGSSSGSSSTSAGAPQEGADACVPPAPELVRAELDEVVSVFLSCGTPDTPVQLVEVERVVPADGAPLRAALDQLLLGVTPAEDQAGFRSIFSSFTASGLRNVTIADGIATIDLTRGFHDTNNFGTSASSGVVAAQLIETVFQFDEIVGIELMIEGERWCGWEATCEGQGVPLFQRDQ